MTHRKRGDRFGNAPFMYWKTKIHYEYFEENKLGRLFGAMALLTCEWSRGSNLLCAIRERSSQQRPNTSTARNFGRGIRPIGPEEN